MQSPPPACTLQYPKASWNQLIRGAMSLNMVHMRCSIAKCVGVLCQDQHASLPMNTAWRRGGANTTWLQFNCATSDLVPTTGSTMKVFACTIKLIGTKPMRAQARDVPMVTLTRRTHWNNTRLGYASLEQWLLDISQWRL